MSKPYCTPTVTRMQVIPVAGHDCMLLNLSGAHGPFFTRNIVILTDSAGRTGLGEVPGGEKIRQTLEDARPLIEGQAVGDYNRLLNELGAGSSSRSVAEVMETGVLPLDIDTSVYDAHQRMKNEHRFALPVTEGGVYRGIFTSDRLVHLHRQVAPAPLPGFGRNDSVGSIVNGLLRQVPRPR